MACAHVEDMTRLYKAMHMAVSDAVFPFFMLLCFPYTCCSLRAKASAACCGMLPHVICAKRGASHGHEKY